MPGYIYTSSHAFRFYLLCFDFAAQVSEAELNPNGIVEGLKLNPDRLHIISWYQERAAVIN